MIVSKVFVMGALVRSSFRRELFSNRIEFEEDRGFLSSAFCVKADKRIIDKISRYCRELSKVEHDVKIPNKLMQEFKDNLPLYELSSKTVHKGFRKTKIELSGQPETINALLNAIGLKPSA